MKQSLLYPSLSFYRREENSSVEIGMGVCIMSKTTHVPPLAE